VVIMVTSIRRNSANQEDVISIQSEDQLERLKPLDSHAEGGSRKKCNSENEGRDLDHL
jgi:hypothetical protein